MFTKYQKFRDDLMRPNEKGPEDKVLEKSVRELVASYQAGQTTDVLGRLGKFLSTPVDESTSLPEDSAQATPLAGSAVSLALDILITILRAVILKF